MTPLTQEWVQKVEADFETARWVMRRATDLARRTLFGAAAALLALPAHTQAAPDIS